MSFQSSLYGYASFMPESSDGLGSVADDVDDSFTCSMCYTSYQKDLQLAAQLGKTLLERNKELETTIRQNQNVIEDQSQEIEYLTKQTAALREVNDSRLRIYEQLEVSVLDLERANQRLAHESAADKKHIKTLCVNIDNLEARNDELQKQIENLQQRLSSQSAASRHEGNNTNTPSKREGFAEVPRLEEEVDRLRGNIQELKSQRLREQRRTARLEEQVRVLELENHTLEEQLSSIQAKEEEMKSLQEDLNALEEIRNGQLCGRCSQKMDQGILRGPLYQSLHLLAQDGSGPNHDDEEDEDVSVIDSLVKDCGDHSPAIVQMQDPFKENPYRDLVQKYEALVQIQSNRTVNRRPVKQKSGSNINASAPVPPSELVGPASNCLSLQEELQMSGDFNGVRSNEDYESGNEEHEAPNSQRKPNANVTSDASRKKAFSTTPTDFSEAETSSSGFSDEIMSNKSTQTEIQRLAGSFLCTIDDGEECRFSIYDSASPVDSRFRKTPEYRNLFREIFDVLKRAAEAKDEGEKLPLLDDQTGEPPRVPPVTPAKEELPLLKMLAQDGTQTSMISEEASEICSELCSEICSEVCSEVGSEYIADAEVQRVTSALDEETGEGESLAEAGPSTITPSASASGSSADKQASGLETSSAESDPEPKPASPAPKRDIMEYLAMGLGHKKKSHSRKNSPHASPRRTTVERIDPALLPLRGLNAKVTYRKKKGRHSESPSRTADQESHSRSSSGQRNSAALSARCRQEADSAGRSSHSSRRPEGVSHSQSAWDFKPVSTASQEVARLKNLEMTYADALRMPNQRKANKFTQVQYRMSYPK